LTQPQDEIGQLTFESSVHQQIFLATLDSSSYPNTKVFVKLVSGSYSQNVQDHLAAEELAPKLYGFAKVDGAPTAYIMEYLDPSTWQTLYEFLQSDAALFQLRDALQKITTRLNSKEYVHGDLRTNNIMIRTNSPRESPDLKVIDFDWAAPVNQVRYPAARNPQIKGIKWPGKAGGLIQDGHDWELISSWLPPE